MKNVIIFGKDEGPFVVQVTDQTASGIFDKNMGNLSDEDIASLISRTTGRDIESVRAFMKETKELNANVLKNDLRQLEFDIKELVREFIDKHKMYPFGNISIYEKPIGYDIEVKLSLRE